MRPRRPPIVSLKGCGRSSRGLIASGAARTRAMRRESRARPPARIRSSRWAACLRTLSPACSLERTRHPTGRRPHHRQMSRRRPQFLPISRPFSTVFVSWVFGEDTVKVLRMWQIKLSCFRNSRSEALPWNARWLGSNISDVCVQRCTESSSAALLATTLSVRVLQVTDIEAGVSVDLERKLSWCLSTP